MAWNMIIACILIFAGAMVMLRCIIRHRSFMLTVRDATAGFSKRTSGLIQAHKVFMFFFLFAYLLVIYFIVEQIDVINNLFIALIFFLGATFVYIGILIQGKAFDLLNSSNRELKKYATKLEENQSKLLTLNKDLKKEIEQKVIAQESEQLKTDFLSQVSHELRTPLTSIFGFTKLIQKDFETIRLGNVIHGPLVKKQKRIEKNIEIISSECSRLTRMINNVLDLAKIESGQANWNDEVVSLEDIIESSVQSVNGLVLEKPYVTLNVDISGSLPTIYIDADLITQVLVNLLSNAIKFTDSGEIAVRFMVTDQNVVITVRDPGVGISPESLSKIFDKYYIARNGNTLSSSKLGTGLGLPICKQIVSHYGGEIVAESEMGKGSLFSVVLPRSIIVE